jgi:hypothetical protein
VLQNLGKQNKNHDRPTPWWNKIDHMRYFKIQSGWLGQSDRLKLFLANFGCQQLPHYDVLRFRSYKIIIYGDSPDKGLLDYWFAYSLGLVSKNFFFEIF